MKALQEIVLKIMNRNLFLQKMIPVNLTIEQLNPKSTGIMHVLLQITYYGKYEGSAINGSQDIEWKPILHTVNKPCDLDL